MALTLAEQYTLRILTGRVVGEGIVSLFKNDNIGIITSKSYICTSFAGALGATIVSKQAGLVDVDTFVIEDNIDKDKFSKFIENKDLVFLAFGGEFNIEQNRKLTENVLTLLKDLDYKGYIFFHVRIWVPGIVEELYTGNKNIKDFLKERVGLYTFTFDLDKGLFIINDIYFTENEISIIFLKTLSLTHIHLSLLKASL